MLKGIDERLVPQLLLALAEMGHGDVIAVVDRNFPAHSGGARVVELPGVDAAGAIEAILTVLPVDRFEDPAIIHMLTDDGEESPATPRARAVWEAAEGRPVEALGVDRRSRFYGLAREAYVTVRTGETLPYGCYLIAKGTV
jgi:L-fucose mutarotase